MARASDRSAELSPRGFFGLGASRASQVARPFIVLPTRATCAARSCLVAAGASLDVKDKDGPGPWTSRRHGDGYVAVSDVSVHGCREPNLEGKWYSYVFYHGFLDGRCHFGKCPSPPSCSGDTPLDDARSQGHDNVVKLLESAVPGLHLKCAKDAQNSVVSHRFLCIKTRTCTGEAEPTNDALLHPARSNQHII